MNLCGMNIAKCQNMNHFLLEFHLLQKQRESKATYPL